MPIYFDTIGNREEVGDKIKNLIHKEKDELLIVSPYISNIKSWKTEEKLGRIRNVKIICDLDSSSCNPYLVEKLLKKRKKNIQVKMLPNIHAKAYISKKAIITGSANFTQNGVGPGSIEVVNSNAQLGDIKQGRKWFENLWDNVASKDARCIKEPEWKRLKANWDRRDWKEKGLKTHFADEFLSSDHDALFFLFWSGTGVLDEKDVKNALKGTNIRMASSNWSYWEELEISASNIKARKKALKDIRRLVKLAQSKTCVNINFKKDNKGNYHEFKRNNIYCSKMHSFVREVPYKEDCIIICTFFEEIKQMDCPFSISGEKTTEFLKSLNDSLKKNRKEWKRFKKTPEGEYGYCDANTLKNVLLKGII